MTHFNSVKKAAIQAVLIFLSIFMIIGCATTSSGDKKTQGTQKKHISSAIFSQYGFRLVEQKQIEMISGTAYILEHIKSGAQVYYIDNNDKNLSFNIQFLHRQKQTTVRTMFLST